MIAGANTFCHTARWSPPEWQPGLEGTRDRTAAGVARVIITPRLKLRPFERGDATAFHGLAGDWRVARMTSDIPHPLSGEEAVRWVTLTHGDERFAVLDGAHLIGSVGYWQRGDGVAELGFWLGPDSWGRGFATEDARALLGHGFETGRQGAFSTSHFIDNPASARVIAKLGFARTGRIRLLSPARGQEVEAITYRLEAADAVRLGIASAATVRRAPLRRLVGLVRG